MREAAEKKVSESNEAHGAKSMAPHQESPRKPFAVLAAVFLLGVVIWLIPPPYGVQPAARHLLAIFIATIVGIITKPLPMGAIALISIATTALSRTLTINQSLSGFGNS